LMQLMVNYHGPVEATIPRGMLAGRRSPLE
jgi:hypothetical protein